MDKRIISVIGVLAGLIFFWRTPPSQETPADTAGHEMGGSVVEAGEGSIVGRGNVSGEVRTVTFILTSETIFTTQRLMITEEQIRSDQPYQPQTERVSGSVADLAVGAEL